MTTVAKGQTSKASETGTLKAGDPAPDFTLTSHTGEEFTLSKQRGRRVVLAFFPAAFTGTCSVQMPLYEREMERVRERDAVLVGISADTRFALAAWAEKLGGIGYPLLSDHYPHGDVAQRYGVLMPNGLAERALIVIDEAGIVRYIDVHETREVPDEATLFCELEKLSV